MSKVARKVQVGSVIDITATAVVSGGDPVNFGDRVGIASADAVIGETIALQVDGVFEFTAVTADAIAIGDKIYLDNVGSTDATVVSTSNKVIGYAATTKVAGVSGTVNVLLGA